MGYSKNRPFIKVDVTGEVDKRFDEVSSQLAEKATKTALNKTKYVHRTRHVIEEKIEANQYNLPWVAVTGGTSFNGTEVHATRYSYNDQVSKNSTEWGKMIFQTRQSNGDFVNSDITSKLPTTHEWRDPNLTVDPSGMYLILKLIGAKWNVDTYLYTTGIFVMDKSYNVLKSYVDITPNTRAAFGNLLFTPAGNIIFSAFGLMNEKVVYLYKSPRNDLFNLADPGTMFDAYRVLDDTIAQPNETCMAYWGKKLVLIARQAQANGIYMECVNEEGVGADTWINKIDLGRRIHSPAIQPYNNEFDDLVFAGAEFDSNQTSGYRKLFISKVPFNPVQYLNGSTWDYVLNFIPIDDGTWGGAAYPSLVKNSFGFSMMYYDPYDGIQSNGLYHKDVESPELHSSRNKKQYDINAENTILNGKLQYSTMGPPKKRASTVGTLDTRIFIRAKKDFKVNEITIPLRSKTEIAENATLDFINTTGTILTTTDIVSVSNLASVLDYVFYTFTFSNNKKVAANIFADYMIRINGNVDVFTMPYLVPVIFEPITISYVGNTTQLSPFQYTKLNGVTIPLMFGIRQTPTE